MEMDLSQVEPTTKLLEIMKFRSEVSAVNYWILILMCACSCGMGRRHLSKGIRRQTADFNAGGMPHHLPSPPVGGKQDGPPPPQGGPMPGQNSMFNSVDVEYGGYNSYNYYQETTTTGFDDEESTTEVPDDDIPEDDEGDDDDDPAPFGLDDTILILVPQFKYTITGFPAWCGANVRLSLPITLFFEEMNWPDKEKAPIPLHGISTGFGSHFFNRRFGGPRRNFYHRHRRETQSILSLPPGESIQGGERATIIPKLEQLLGRFGIKSGRACLLRAVCEVHDNEIHRSYGFLGEFLTHMFSISNSIYAESHLSSYLEAERRGKQGNCSYYYEKCTHSLFEKEKEKKQYCELGSWNCDDDEYD